MKQEEKAQAYDKVREKIALRFGSNVADEIFSQFEMSEDESIRKALKEYFINSFQNNGVAAICGVHIKDILAWLEKQGEQNPTDEEMNTILRTEYEKGRADAIAECQKEWSEEDGSMLYGVMETEQYMLDVVNGVKKFDVGNDDIRKACAEELNWLQYLKNRALTQPKQEWSEEDEKEVAVLEAYIHSKDWSDRHIDRALGIVDELVKKVKSRRPQNRWKPTDGELYVLRLAAEKDGTCLMGLYEQLKKLMEE